MDSLLIDVFETNGHFLICQNRSNTTTHQSGTNHPHIFCLCCESLLFHHQYCRFFYTAGFLFTFRDTIKQMSKTFGLWCTKQISKPSGFCTIAVLCNHFQYLQAEQDTYPSIVPSPSLWLCQTPFSTPTILLHRKTSSMFVLCIGIFLLNFPHQCSLVDRSQAFVKS